ARDALRGRGRDLGGAHRGGERGSAGRVLRLPCARAPRGARRGAPPARRARARALRADRRRRARVPRLRAVRPRHGGGRRAARPGPAADPGGLRLRGPLQPLPARRALRGLPRARGERLGLTRATWPRAPAQEHQVEVNLSWPRISPAGFFAVCTFTYAPPALIVFSSLLVMVATPLTPLRHGAQSGTTML